MAVEKFSYKVENETISTDIGEELSTLFVFGKVSSKPIVYQGKRVVEADYRLYRNQNAFDNDLQGIKGMIDGKRLTAFIYEVPANLKRTYNLEQFMLVEKQMIADTFGFDAENITIQVDSVDVPDSTFD
jgi:hypothetical protein